MKSQLLVACLLASGLSAAAAVSTNAAGGATNSLVVAPPPLQIVACREIVSADALIQEYQLTPRFRYRAINGFAAPMNEATLRRLQADERVRFVEADWVMSLCVQSNSTGLVRMGIDQFPIAKIDGIPDPLDVDVAVLDSGIDVGHSDLNVYTNYDVDEFDFNDHHGHGTAMAGIIGALDNDLGVVGIAPGARLWNVKLSDTGIIPGSSSLIGMQYVYDNADRISVANMSFGGSPSGHQAVRFYLQQLLSAGVVVVAGAGNNTNDVAGLDGVYGVTGSGCFGCSDDFMPAASPESMAVSAMVPTTDIFALYSNFSSVPRNFNHVVSPGGAIDVAAPGDNILTTARSNGYIFLRFGGTSSATAHVTGLVALYIAANGRVYDEAGVYRIRQAIVNNSLPQSQWNSANTHDSDTNHEPLAVASTNWLRPSVIASPANLTVASGEPARMIAETLGLRPLACRWLFNGTNLADGGRISGAASTTLTISNAQPADAGSYQLIITNSYGAATSTVATLTVGNCLGTPAPTGLVAWWRFEGNTQDAVGTNHATSHRGTVFGPAVVGNGLTMDIRSGPLQVADSPELNPTNQLSLEAWYKAVECSADSDVLIKKRLNINIYNQDFDQYSLMVKGNPAYSPSVVPVNSFGFKVNRGFGGTGGSVYTPTNSWLPGNWYHIVGTYDGQEAKIYVNGQLLGASPYVASSLRVDNLPVTIGGSEYSMQNGYTNSTPGALDELSIYNRALSAGEVSALYNAGSGGKCLAAGPQPPLITAITHTNGTVTLIWSAVPGQKYQVQTATVLNGLAWTNLSGTITSMVTSLQYSDALDSTPQKYYRIQLVP